MPGIRLRSGQRVKVDQNALETLRILSDDRLELLSLRLGYPRLREHHRGIRDGVDVVLQLVGDGAIELAEPVLSRSLIWAADNRRK